MATSSWTVAVLLAAAIVLAVVMLRALFRLVRDLAGW